MERYVYKGTVVSVIDGDTVEIEFQLGFDVNIFHRCRLLGINTPETYGVKKDSEEYKRGKIAKDWLVDKILGETLIIKTHKDQKGKYGRYLVELFMDEKSIAEEMIEKGLGVAYYGGKR